MDFFYSFSTKKNLFLLGKIFLFFDGIFRKFVKHLIEKLKKLNEQLGNINKEILRSENLLNNEKFLSKAKKEKVDEEKEKYQKYKEQKEILEEKIKNI